MQIRPVLVALRKHRLASIVIALQVALAFGVLCNSCFLIARRVQAMHVVSGVDEPSLGSITLTGFDPEHAADLNARVIDGIRGIAGVQSVGVTSAVPFGEPAVVAGVQLNETKTHFGGVVDFYVSGPGVVESLRLHLLSGRMPTQEEYTPIAQLVPKDAPVLITRVLAERFWPGTNPLGQTIWSIDTRFHVIGVVDHLAVSHPGSGEEEDPDWSVFVPAQPGAQLAGRYLIRADPHELPRVMRDARLVAQKVAGDAVVDPEQSRTLSELREDFFRKDRVMANLLVGVIAALLGTTALGIVGLASYWVTQRRKNIGVRRALGASSGDILRYFQIENFLIVSFGIAFGTVLAFAINLTLTQFYELPRLPIAYLPIGAVVVWVLGQISVLVPALRAAAVPPSIAMRSF